MTDPEPGFVPLSERLGEAMCFLLIEWEQAADKANQARSVHIANLIATLTEAIETLQDVEGRK